jgi:hypothetical protein
VVKSISLEQWSANCVPGVPQKIFKLTLHISRSISKIKCLKKKKKIANYTNCIHLFTSVKLIPLSADTIARRIQDMSDNIDRLGIWIAG